MQILRAVIIFQKATESSQCQTSDLYRFSLYFFDTINNLLIYFNTALGISVLLNIPKFFEAETSVSYEINASGENVTNTRIGISDIRIHPSYITYYTMWTRLLATGIFPLGTIHILRKHFDSTKLTLTFKFFTKTRFFRQNKRISFSMLHFDEIFMLQFEIFST